MNNYIALAIMLGAVWAIHLIIILYIMCMAISRKNVIIAHSGKVMVFKADSVIVTVTEKHDDKKDIER